MSLPPYITEPNHPGRCLGIHDIITFDYTGSEESRRRMPWKSSYQGQTDYISPTGGRCEFRWGKLPWRWPRKPEEKYWNWDREEDFQREMNGAWGILHSFGSDPVDQETLDTFRQGYLSIAVTGYFNHETGLWTICEPTKERLSYQSYDRTKANPNLVPR